MTTDYYTLEGSGLGNSVRVVIHIDVPGSNNAAGIPWQTVAPEFKLSTRGSTISVVPTTLLEPGGQAGLDAGTLYESEFRVADDANATPAVRVANLEAAVVTEASDVLATLQKALNYWGQKGAV